jgi:hypothetical protein
MNRRSRPTRQPSTPEEILETLLRHERDRYKAQKSTHPLIPGVEFASKTERDRAGELLELQQRGRISALCWHPRYVLSKTPSCKVTFDAAYVEPDGQQWVEDTKPARGPISRDFRVRALWFRQLHSEIRVRVVGQSRNGSFTITQEF